MRRQEILNRMREQFALLVLEVRAGSALGQTDIHRICEDVLCPVLRIAMDLPELRNLNQSDRSNFPGIDLGDPSKGVGIQVTSRADAPKLRSSIQALIRNKVHLQYPRLYVYVLEEKQATYRVDLTEDLGGLVEFEPRDDVLDYRDVLALLKNRPIADLVHVVKVLDAELGRPAHYEAEVKAEDEALWMNLLLMDLPAELFVADLLPEARSKRGATRRSVKKHMDQIGVRFATDWTVHESQVLTFHDLSEPHTGLGRIVDQGTVTPLGAAEYFDIGDGYMGAFKDLLRRCLQQKLYHRGVQWQHLERLFIFAQTDDQHLKRRESWTGEVSASRTVFERVPKRDNEEETYHCKHLGFSPAFHRIGDEWFLSIKPEWFFSADGYRKWYFGADRVDYLKRAEKNQHVFNHVKFLVYFLTHDPPPDLFRDFTPYPHLTFNHLVKVDGGPAIDDDVWRAREDPSEQRKLLDPLGDLPLFFDADGTPRSS